MRTLDYPLMRKWIGLKGVLFLTPLFGLYGCAAPDPLELAMEQRSVTYVSGETAPMTAPSTVR